MNKPINISQKENMAGNHGCTLRSSAIFYYKSNDKFRTTISFLNYWKVKRNIEVIAVISIRTMSGSLIKREQLTFNKSNVLNYQPDSSLDPQEGSIEIEIFSITDLVIPYAAIMAVYESHTGISMVHSYSRTYYPHEIEDKRTITVGRESCWTVRDNQNISSFCVFHNGNSIFKDQEIELTVTNFLGEKVYSIIHIEQLYPYQSVKLYPKDFIAGLIRFLDGKPGNASLNFELGNSFTRLLVGNESRDDFQVTHSNFNYSKHQSDQIENGNEGYMHIVNPSMLEAKVVVYPDCQPGSYLATNDINEETTVFNGDNRHEINVIPGQLLKFIRKDGPMPTRIVTGFSGSIDTKKIPFECSLGIHHIDIPAKHSHWGIITTRSDVKCKLICQIQPELFEYSQEVADGYINIYSAHSNDVLSTALDGKKLTKLNDGIYIDELFQNLEEFLKSDFGYFYLNTSYPGLTCFTTLENTSGSMSLEHTF